MTAENRLSNTAVPYALQDFFNRVGININVTAFRNLSANNEVLIQFDTKEPLTQIKVLEHVLQPFKEQRDMFVISTLEEEKTVLAALKAFDKESKEYYPHQKIETKDFERVRYFIDSDNLLTAFLFKTKNIDRYKDYQKNFKNDFLHQQDQKRKHFINSNFEMFFSNSIVDFDIFKLFSVQLTAEPSQDNQLNKIINQINYKMNIDTVFTTLENFSLKLWQDLHFRVDFDTVKVLDTNKREFALDVGFSFIQNHKDSITFLGKHIFKHTTSTTTSANFEVELTEEAQKEIQETFDLFTNDRFVSTQMHCQKVGTFKNKSVYPPQNREHLLIFSNENDIRIYFVFDKTQEEEKDDINALLANREQFLRDNYQILLEKENGNRLVFEVLRYTIKSPYFAGRLKEIGTKAVNIESLQKEEPKLIEKIKELENVLFTDTEN
ncbi:hypothetical protein WAF17_22555 (plasmid) [Bernardetia sp. ABR2-2B]|uniref:hypothetical protein n=1 Tax=Bernardetia sp. ABR2-2B TaxID=3127472 RepID=UPI0030D22CF1